MKKPLLLILTLICVVCFAASLVACNNDSSQSGISESEPEIFLYTQEYLSGATYTTSDTVQRIDAEGNASETGDYVYFGMYPQTKVTSDQLAETLTTQAGTLPTSESALGWTSYGYYISGTAQNYMWYKDVENNGDRYRGVYFNQYRPYWTYSESSDAYSNQRNNGYSAGAVYWFKFEPIRWRILSYDSASTEALIISDIILDSQSFMYSSKDRTISAQTVAANDWTNSSLRTFMNGTFYDTAFTNAQKGLVVEATSLSTNMYPSGTETTNDNLYPLTKEVLQNSSYFANNAARQRKATEYAKCQGAYASKDSETLNNGYYWTRSCNTSASYFEYYVSSEGKTDDYHLIQLASYGVVPATTIRIHSCTVFDTQVIDDAHLASAATCTSPAKYFYTCSHGFMNGSTFEVGEALGHEGGEATCTDRKICTRCGEEYGDLLAHTYSAMISRVEPTCGEPGEIAHCICTRCNKYFDSNHVEITTGIDIPPTGHTVGETFTLVPGQAATCTVDGVVEHYHCTQCNKDYVLENAEYVEIYNTTILAGHTYGELVPGVAVSCDEDGVDAHYYCSVCGTYFDDTKTATTLAALTTAKLNHSYGSDHICTRCGLIDSTAKAAIASNGYYKSESSIYFGSYPQIRVHDTTLVAALTTQAGTLPTTSETGWTSYGYYINSIYANSYMWYKDIVYSGETYRAVYFKYYRPTLTSNVAGEENSLQDDNGYAIETLYFFRFEPIGWKILEERNAEVLVISNVIIDAREFGQTNNWGSDHSLRSWLNGDFYQNTFDATQKQLIQEQTLVTPTYNGGSTETENIYVYTMLRTELSDTNYGFNADAVASDILKQLKVTEYAKAQGAYVDENGYGEWWTRTCSTDGSAYEYYVSTLGEMRLFESSANTSVGVVPTIRMRLCTCNESAHTHETVGDTHIYTPADCTHAAVYYKTCEHGHNGLTTFTSGDPLGHDYQDIILPNDANIVAGHEATCTEDAQYYKVCSRCGDVSSTTFTAADTALGHAGGHATCTAKAICDRCGEAYGPEPTHSYVNGLCTKCGSFNLEAFTFVRVDENNAPSETGEYLYFGFYPQTQVTDSALVSSLNSAAGSNPTPSNNQSWTPYDYYIANGHSTAYMWFIDITHTDNNKYRGVYFTSLRPASTSSSSTAANSYQDDNGYSKNTVYWFKYEPIKWRILSQNGSNAFIVAESVLDSQNYNISTNDWAGSNLQTWLNNTFYNAAFNTVQKALVQSTQLTTQTYAGGTAASTDKVFVLSQEDVTNTAYGYNSDISAQDPARQLVTTEYTRAQGAWISYSSTTWHDGYWWIRTCSPTNQAITYYIYYEGGQLTQFMDNVNATYVGVVPALYVNLG